jgi:importin subunit alpha-1
LIYNSEAVLLLLRLLSTAPFDIRKEVAYVLGNLCVAQTEGDGKPNLILEHLVSLVGRGCLPGFIDLVRSADTESARVGLQFMELVSKYDGKSINVNGYCSMYVSLLQRQT